MNRNLLGLLLIAAAIANMGVAIKVKKLLSRRGSLDEMKYAKDRADRLSKISRLTAIPLIIAFLVFVYLDG